MHNKTNNMHLLRFHDQIHSTLIIQQEHESLACLIVHINSFF